MRVFVYGAGRVGRAFCRGLERQQGPVVLTGAWNQTFGRALETSQLLEVEVWSGDAIPGAFIKADVIVLSVVDDALVEVAELLAPHIKRKQVLIHTSGSLPATVMRVKGMAATLGCCHPLQALADPQGDYLALQGATFGVDGDPEGVGASFELASALGGSPLQLDSAGKVYYHAAAVMAANYLTSLMDAAAELALAAGIEQPDAVRMLDPLLRGTLNNHMLVAGRGERLGNALTGPVRRGDVGTVKAHLQALKRLGKTTPNAHDIEEIYRVLGRRAVALAVEGGLDDTQATALRSLLEPAV